MGKKVVLETKDISKEFPGVKALSGISIDLYQGEVLSIVGENGAGKSTLIKILAGAQFPDSGEIRINEEQTKLTSPIDAKKKGVSVVYQELTFIPELTVAENLFSNQYGLSSNITVSWKKINESAKLALEAVGLKIDTEKKIKTCSVAEKQQIEIARAMYEDAKILILDEPTSALNDQETESLLSLVKKLKKLGVATIFISHKMDEVFSISDRVIVLRDGELVANKEINETNPQELIMFMAGREIKNMYPQKTNKPNDVRMKVCNITNEYVRDISFELRKGEVLGVYGLMGSGHLELGKTLFGAVKKTCGDVYINGLKVSINSPRRCIANGISFLPSDRKTEGLVLIQSVQENIMTPYYEKNVDEKIISRKLEKLVSNKWVKNLAIKTPSKDTLVGALSGGNQQKVVLAKWLEVKPQIIIMSEPTRGIDVGAKTEIYKILNELAEEGISIIMITSEMPELMAMSDHVIVMHEGSIIATLTKDEINQKNIMSAAIGGIVHD